MSEKLKVVVLACILLVALFLRLWGVNFGLPYVYHFDEHFYINTALQLGAGVWHNPPYAATGLSNILFGEYALYYLLGRTSGWFESPTQFAMAYRSDPTVFYLLARGTVAAMATTTVLVVYGLGSAVRGGKVGMLAALFLTISFLHVRDAHYAVPDAAMPLFVVLSILLAVQALNGQGRWRQSKLMLAGIAGGFAIAMKWIALPVMIPLGLASFCAWRQAVNAKQHEKIQHVLLLTSAGLAIGFVLGSPQILMNPHPYLREALGQYASGQAGGFEFWQVDDVSGWRFYLNTLLWGLGPALVGFAIMGVCMRLADGIRMQRCVSWLLVLFPLVYYISMGATRHYFARYTLPLAPFLALFAAEAVTFATEWLRMNKSIKAGQIVLGALAITIIVQPLANSIRHDLLLTDADTRTLAKLWIERHIPPGVKIAVDWPTHVPPLSTPEHTDPHSERVYDVTIVGGTGLSEHSVEWYRRNGFDYLIASSFIYRIPVVFPEQERERQAFYTSLAREFTAVQTFYPTGNASEPDFIFDEIYGPAISLWQRERPGPTIRIYQVK